MNKLLLIITLIPSLSFASFDAYYHNQNHPDIYTYRAPHTVSLPKALGLPRRSLSQGNSPVLHKRIMEIQNEEKEVSRYNIENFIPPRPVTQSAVALSSIRHDSIVNSQHPHPSPEAVHVAEVQAHASEVKSLSKKKVACLVAATAITSSILTAAVTLTIHFTECQK